MIACSCPACRPDLRDRIIGTTECRASAQRAHAMATLRAAATADRGPNGGWILETMDRIELRQHARDRREEREDIELGYLDIGEAGA